MKTHEYKVVNASFYPSIEIAANRWADLGWRTVGVIGARSKGYADQLILEKPVETPPENSGVWIAYHSDWSGFALFGDEETALRYAVDNSMQCMPVMFGVDPRRGV